MHATVRYIGTNKLNNKVFEVMYGNHKFVFVLSNNRLENCRKILKIISDILSHEFGFYFEIEHSEFPSETYMLILPYKEGNCVIISCSTINLNINSAEDLEKSINEALNICRERIKSYL